MKRAGNIKVAQELTQLFTQLSNSQTELNAVAHSLPFNLLYPLYGANEYS